MLGAYPGLQHRAALLVRRPATRSIASSLSFPQRDQEEGAGYQGSKVKRLRT